MALRKVANDFDGDARLSGTRADFDQAVGNARTKRINGPQENANAEPRASDVIADIKRRHDEGESHEDIWLDAVAKGDKEVVAAFLLSPPEGFDVNWTNANGQTALHLAMGKDPELVKLLVETGEIDVAVIDQSGRSALQYATGEMERSGELAAEGQGYLSGEQFANMWQNGIYLKPQMQEQVETAYRNGDQSRYEALIEAGAQPLEVVDELSNLTQVQNEFFLAVENGDIDTVRYMLANHPEGFDINARNTPDDPNEIGDTALDIAVLQNFDKDRSPTELLEMVEVLVEEGGANIADLNAAGNSAYQQLLSLGGDENPQNSKFDDLQVDDDASGAGQILSFLGQELDAQARDAFTTDRNLYERLVQAGAQEVDGLGAGPGSPPTPDTTMPQDNNRPETGQEVLDNSALFQSLDEDQRNKLKDAFWNSGQGDIEKDVDAAYRLVQALEHVEQYAGIDALGDPALVGNNKIDGDAETDRLDLFTQKLNDEGVRQGFDYLATLNVNVTGYTAVTNAGGSGGEPATDGDPPKIDTVRPEGDTRDAMTILNDSALFGGLSDQHRQELKDAFWNEGAGSIYEDADLAYRLVQSLEHLEAYTPDANQPGGDTVGDNRFDGFFGNSRLEANPYTEAARLQDFIKAITGDGGGLQAGFDYLQTLKFDARGAEAVNEAESNNTEGEDTIYQTLQLQSFNHIVEQAGLTDEERAAIIANPQDFSPEQRYAAQLELEIAKRQILANPELWNPKSAANAVPNGLDIHLSGSVDAALAEIGGAIEKLNSPEVQDYAATADTNALQHVLSQDPGLRAQVEKMYQDMKNFGLGLEQYIGEGKDTEAGLQTYYTLFQSLNEALGTNGAPLDENPQIEVGAGPAQDAIKSYFESSFEDPLTLNNLIEKYKNEGLSEEEAQARGFTDFQSRHLLLASFGVPSGDLLTALQSNQQNYVYEIGTLADLEAAGIVDAEGYIDFETLEQVLTELHKTDPGNAIFKNENGEWLTVGQILTSVRAAPDFFRNLAKVSDKAGDIDKNRVLAKDNLFQDRIFGTGAAHLFSALMTGGIIAARSASGGQMSKEVIAATVGLGVQMTGLGIQGYEFTQRGKPTIDKSNWWRPEVSTGNDPRHVKPTLMNSGKVVNGLGGLLNGTASIAVGVAELESGNRAGAAMWLTLGVSNTITALGPLAEAGQFGYYKYYAERVFAQTHGPRTPGALSQEWQDFDAAKKTGIARLFYYGGAASAAFNVVGGLASLVGGIVGLAQHAQRLGNEEEYFDTFAPTLDAYGVGGGGRTDVPRTDVNSDPTQGPPV